MSIADYVIRSPERRKTPEGQLETVRMLNDELKWGFAASDFPAVPEPPILRFGELLLLCVNLPAVGIPGVDRRSGLHRTFDVLWNLLLAPDGYTKDRHSAVEATQRTMRLPNGYRYKAGIYWVAFDPSNCMGYSPGIAEATRPQDVRLAGVEALMAALIRPDALLGGWNLSGLQVCKRPDDWAYVPCLKLWETTREKKLMLDPHDIAYPYRFCSSPTVRELQKY